MKTYGIQKKNLKLRRKECANKADFSSIVKIDGSLNLSFRNLNTIYLFEFPQFLHTGLVPVSYTHLTLPTIYSV